MKPAVKIIRLHEVLHFLPLSKSTMYLKIQKGLLPPSISLGQKAVGFIEHEYQAVLAAMITGEREEELKKLVKSLVEDRQNLKMGAYHDNK